MSYLNYLCVIKSKLTTNNMKKIKITQTVEGFYQEGQVLEHVSDRFTKDGEFIGCAAYPEGKSHGEAGTIGVFAGHYMWFATTEELISEYIRVKRAISDHMDEFTLASFDQRIKSVSDQLSERGINTKKIIL